MEDSEVLILPYGPYRPKPLERISNRYRFHPERLTLEFFDEIVSQGSSGFFNPDYNTRILLPHGVVKTYLCSFSFKAGLETFTILFPHLHKVPVPDGTGHKTYAIGTVDMYSDIECDAHWRTFAANLFAETFVRFYKKHYRSSILASKIKNGVLNTDGLPAE